MSPELRARSAPEGSLFAVPEPVSAATARSSAGASGVHAAAIFSAACVMFMLLLINRSVVYGSQRGNWVYPYVAEATPELLRWAALSFVIVATSAWLSMRFVERAPLVVVFGCILAAFAFHVLTRKFETNSLARVVASDGCMSFFSVARRYAPLDLLARFEELVPKLPAHARTNMPGKTLLLQALMNFDTSARGVGYLVIALADLGGLVIYGVARRWFKSRQAAVIALILYLVLPAKNNFFPILNVISPLFIFVPLWLWVVYLDRPRHWVLGLLGASLYVLLAFEPLPFVLGLIFVGMLAQRLACRAYAWQKLPLLAVVVVAGFALAHVAAKVVLRFDAIDAFWIFLDDAVDFNRRDNRPYEVWVIQNLPEFFIGAGVFASLIVWSAWFQLGADFLRGLSRGPRAGALRRLVTEPSNNLLLFLFVTIATVDLLGVNRGEITRLWIFISVTLQVAVAGFCVRRYGSGVAALAAGAGAAQALVSTGMIGFLMC